MSAIGTGPLFPARGRLRRCDAYGYLCQNCSTSRPHMGRTCAQMMPDGADRCLRSSKGWRRLTAVLAVVTVLGTGVWVGRDWLLLSAADLWIVSDPIGPADAVAVFGGGLGDRPFAAAQYYREGLVKRILIDLPDSEAVLLEVGIPSSAIETFGSGLKNTNQEALALKGWAERNNACSIIVPTEIFSARRVRWMLHRAFGDECVLRVIALDPPQIRRDWWRHTQGVSAFQNEILKYIYYRLNY
jgi:uncharacterized SAM-binding protein YcdF (DUF218 family)